MAFGNTMWLGDNEYSAAEDRMFAMGLTWAPGVQPARDEDPLNALRVARSSGLTVTVASGWALVEGSDVRNQGLYAAYNDGSISVSSPLGAPSSDGRVDLIVATVRDAEAVPGAVPANQMTAFWVTGSPQPGADQTSQTFWPNVPPTSIVLASLLLSPGDSTVSAANLSDQRKLAGPSIWGEDGKRYRLGVDRTGNLGLEEL